MRVSRKYEGDVKNVPARSVSHSAGGKCLQRVLFLIDPHLHRDRDRDRDIPRMQDHRRDRFAYST